MARLPDFLIIGTMKGGTTVLYEFINEHELVEPAEKKEIHYFSLFQHEGVDWYKKHFSVDSMKLVGEASPTYFDMAVSNAIPKSIKKIIPNVKLILIVRDPVERAISHFSHLCRVNNIQELVDMDVNDFFGRSFSEAYRQTNMVDYYLAQVLSFSLYYRKYKNYLSVFNKEQLLVISNEELLKYPQTVMTRVFDFLELKPIESKLFEQFKYSTGPKKKNVNERNLERLKEYLYSDYEIFCNEAGVEFESEAKLIKSTPDVMVGLNGWLYLTGGSNSPLDYYTGKKIFDMSMIESWHNLLRDRYKKLNDKGIEYIHIFVPNKLTLYPEYSTVALDHISGSPIKAFMRGVKNFDDVNYLHNVIDSTPYLMRQKTNQQIYYKTDTHWNAYGCFSSYQLLCANLGAKGNKDLLSRDYTEGECMFDLGGKLTPKRNEKARFYNFIKDAVRVYANNMVLYKEKNNLENDGGLHVGSNVVFQNPKAANQKTVVLFGDSFSEYRSSLLTAMLAETFSEVHFVWSSSLDYSYINTLMPDIVITQIVERFMPSVPVDAFKLDEYVEKTLKNVVGYG